MYLCQIGWLFLKLWRFSYWILLQIPSTCTAVHDGLIVASWHLFLNAPTLERTTEILLHTISGFQTPSIPMSLGIKERETILGKLTRDHALSIYRP